MYIQAIYQKLRNSHRKTSSFIHHLCYFSYLLWIAPSEGHSLTTLFSTKMRGRKQPQEHQHPSPILLHFCHSSPASGKTILNLRSLRKFKHARHIDQRLCNFLLQMLKTVSILFINSELVTTLYSVWLLSNLKWKQ